MSATFYSYAEKALRAGATTPVAGGRLSGATRVDLADLTTAASTSVPVRYDLFGPGDVLRLGAGTVLRRFPGPGTSDAEETKLVHVEFEADDLPWRYSPTVAADSKLAPWLVLVVGERKADQIVVRPDGRVGIGTTTQGRHPLARSYRWAHVHQVGARTVSRLLSPLDLQPATEYVACLVPSYTAEGQPAWTGAQAVTVDCYDRWTFRTGPAGDFPQLAAALHKADLAAIEAAGGKPFGKAAVSYVHRSDATRTVLPTGGALRLPPTPQPDPADAPVEAAVAAEVGHLSDRIVTPDGRGVVTAPRYDAPFVTAATQEAFAATGWVAQLREDPRLRGTAGLGAWNAIAWQDRIADAAARKAGDLAVADDRIRHVALGVEASRSIWRRRVPPLPAAGDGGAAADLLAVLGPALGRLPAEGGQTVLDAIAGRTPRLGRALFSSAARRVLRPGPARNARAADGAASLAGALGVANRCRERGRDPADIRREDVPAERVEEAAKAALLAVAPLDGELVEELLGSLFGNGRRPAAAELAAAVRAVAPGPDGHADPAAVKRFLDRHDERAGDPGLRNWGRWIDEATGEHRQPCRPLDLVGLATAVAGAIDPNVALPPAARRVLATLPGFTSFGPVEIEPELDLPLWSFLSASAPDWMLPGAGDLKVGDVVAMATDPRFVQALLVGANAQTTGELRWRNLPMTSRWSPLRKFWQRTGGDFDIVPIKGWADSGALGAPAFAFGGKGSEAVVVFRTPLFRRYPATVVYLYRDLSGTWEPPAEGQSLDAPDRVDHVFTGTIGDDITFFGFPVDPAALTTHWVVLEEPPAGYRFFAVPPDGAPPEPDPDQVTATDFAYNRFAVPVRVLIGQLLDDGP